MTAINIQQQAKDILLEALAFYKIPLISDAGYIIAAPHNYTIEIEQNGLYKLKSDGYVIAPFDDVNKLCRFILT
ncbi:MAG: hypothetical protein KF862_19185 [Chitinophagaceae bacterium]|nr:hypothetical protein [Chitinophagaceae bacterium]